ncbi:MATE family efflux transporter [Helcococcus sueciensis]|uniref:MATE family efflux transporter n=1 Tax=Helcococcus sueciensis TaxID=241555 RepID=UPI0004192388|nr:MATE family efflux transporter [Helcococcus sueciensis]
MLQNISKDKQFYKQAIKIAWPSVLESFFIALAGMIDTIMVSALGSYAISAIGLTNQPKFIALTVFIAVNTAISALIARRRGQEDKKGANEVFLTAFTINIILCVFITAIFLFYIEDIIRLSGSNADTHDSAVGYLRIIIAGQIFNIIAMTINSAQRGSGNTKIAFTTNLVSSAVNIMFNFLLINGNLGFPAMGIQGAAIATVAGTIVASIMSFISLYNRNSMIQVKYIYKHKIKPTMESLKSIFNLSYTIFLESIMMRIGFLATALTSAKLGTDIFAAQNAASNYLNIAFSFADGMQVAAIALSGRALGADKKDVAIKYVHVCQRIGFMISIIISVVLFVFGENLMQLFFNPDTQAQLIEYGLQMTKYIMVIVLLQISQIIYGGALRSGGDVKFALYSTIISVSIVRTAATLILVNVFNMGLHGIWIGILVDQLLRYILLHYRFKTGRWTEITI